MSHSGLSEIAIYPPMIGPYNAFVRKRSLSTIIEPGMPSSDSANHHDHVNVVNGEVVDWTVPWNVMMALTAVDSELNAAQFPSSQVNECLHSLVSALESMDPVKIRQHITTYTSMIHRPDILMTLTDEDLLTAAYSEIYSIDSFLDHQYVNDRYPAPNII